MNAFDPDEYAQAVANIFAALAQLPEVPASVRVAAGVLALVAGPADAGAWVESARQAALKHDARGFVCLFENAVTKKTSDASPS